MWRTVCRLSCRGSWQFRRLPAGSAGTKFPVCLSHGKQIVAKIAQPGNVRAMETWLVPFAALFTQPTWLNAVALATGALLVVVLGLMGWAALLDQWCQFIPLASVKTP